MNLSCLYGCERLQKAVHCSASVMKIEAEKLFTFVIDLLSSTDIDEECCADRHPVAISISTLRELETSSDLTIRDHKRSQYVSHQNP